METTCGSLIKELQKIWDEVGETDLERDKMLLELEQECLEAYRKRVDQASRNRARLRQAVADSEAELAYICATLGERPVHLRQGTRNLKKELQAIMPHLELMQKKKNERRSQFVDVLIQIHNISKDLGTLMEGTHMPEIDESDLSLKKLEELNCELLALEKEKSNRLKQVLDHLNTLNLLCLVLGMDFKHTVNDVNPSLDNSSSTKNVSVHTIERLSAAISKLKDVKIQRMQKLQDLSTTMVELWSLMDTPIEAQQQFHNVTRLIAASENEITDPNILSLDCITHAEAEVLRLQQMKSKKIKEVLLKKKCDLDELCRRSHIIADECSAMDFSVEALQSGAVDPLYLLEQIELEISKVKEEAFSRKDVLEKVEKWLAACEEECWLEEYNMDENRYNAGRGTHLILKRAERARALVNKIPAMVETLISKARAWKQERGVPFSYDGVHLLSMIEQYSALKQEKEQERQRQRDQKKLQGQLIAEQEALFGSKPSPKSGKKVQRSSTGAASSRRQSLAPTMLQSLNHERTNFSFSSSKKTSRSAKPHNSRYRPQTGGLWSVNAGTRKLDSSGLHARQHSSNTSNTQETESTPARKPLSPVLSAFSSNASSVSNQDPERTESGVIQKAIPSEKTPTKTYSAHYEHEENKTPKTMPNPIPVTPPTISVPMKTAITPVTPAKECLTRDSDSTEYSFEERRAGFFLPKAN